MEKISFFSKKWGEAMASPTCSAVPEINKYKLPKLDYKNRIMGLLNSILVLYIFAFYIYALIFYFMSSL